MKGVLKNSGVLKEENPLTRTFPDLDNINLDDIDLDVEYGRRDPVSHREFSIASGKTRTTTVNADWIASDAPKGADLPGDEISTQDDMSSFAGGASGSDADLLSSLASDVKHVTKEKNTSLLRDLKDFKAPATDIENELND